MFIEVNQDLEMLGRLLELAVPQLRLVADAAETARIYRRLVCAARSEVLVFSRTPFEGDGEISTEMIVAGVSRQVRYRCLHQAAEFEGPGADQIRQAVDRHAQVGVETLVVDEIPIKLAVIDRSTVLLAMPGEALPGAAFPVSLLVEDAGFGDFAADSFDRRWATGRPYPMPRAR